jgi:hypothetical protein
MPHEYKFNQAAFTDGVTRAINTFGFTSTYEGRALGMLLVGQTVEGIQHRSIEKQCDGSGNKWPLNSERTRRRKYRQWGEALVNKDTGQMLSVESLRGKVTVTQYLIRIEYGTGKVFEEADRLPKMDRIRIDGGYAKEPVTDEDKAFYAHQQGRDFYELDQEICDDNFAMFRGALAAHLANPGR